SRASACRTWLIACCCSRSVSFSRCRSSLRFSGTTFMAARGAYFTGTAADRCPYAWRVGLTEAEIAERSGCPVERIEELVGLGILVRRDEDGPFSAKDV